MVQLGGKFFEMTGTPCPDKIQRLFDTSSELLTEDVLRKDLPRSKKMCKIFL